LIPNLILCITLLAASLLSKPRTPLRWYFVCSFVVSTILNFVPFGRFYPLAYVVLSLPCIATAAILVWEAVRRHPVPFKLLMACFGLTSTFVITSAKGQHLDVNDIISLGLGWICMAFAGTAGYGVFLKFEMDGNLIEAPTADKVQACVLSVTWIAQGLYLFGWTLHPWWPNDWAYPMITVAGVALLTLQERLRTQSSQQAEF
jgi:uncharacterized membrane protein